MVIKVENLDTSIKISKIVEDDYNSYKNKMKLLYTLISLFVQYKILKDYIFSFNTITYEVFMFILFVQLGLTIIFYLIYRGNLYPHFNEFIFLNTDRIILQIKEFDSIRNEIIIFPNDILKIYIKRREEVFRYSNKIPDEEYMVIKFKTKKDVFSWGFKIPLEEAEKIKNVIDNYLNNLA